MPNITFEYSSNIKQKIDFPSVCQQLHELVVAGAPPAKLEDCKTRIIAHENFYVADGKLEGAFVILTISLLSGRELATRQQLAQRCLKFLEQVYTSSVNELKLQLAVDIHEMTRETYVKN